VHVAACRVTLQRHGPQVFELGNKAELLVAVWKRDGKEGRTTVELTTDLSSDVVLHWGVKRGPKSDWLAAPKDIVPAHSSVPEVRWDRHASSEHAQCVRWQLPASGLVGVSSVSASRSTLEAIISIPLLSLILHAPRVQDTFIRNRDGQTTGLPSLF